jgi:osmotically inducible protein OsmC
MDVPCTNPSEILAAAEAACVSMMVARELAREGSITAECIETKAESALAPDGDSWNIPRIHLIVKAHVPEVDSAKFQEAVSGRKRAARSRAA